MFGLGTLLAGLAGSVVSQYGKVFALTAAFGWFAKALVLFVVWVALPIVLYNVASEFGVDLVKYGMDQVQAVVGDYSPGAIQLTGMAGWAANQMGLDVGFSLIISAVSMRFLLGFIPGYGR